MKIYKKAFLLLIGLISVFLIIFALLRVKNSLSQVAILRVAKEDKIELADKISRLRGASLETLANDYTAWGEMVSFVKTKDMEWARLNIQPSLGTYHADCAWVYDREYSLVYAINVLGDDSLKDLPVPHGALARIFENKKFCHFFSNTPAGLLEIRGATIHPSGDWARETTPAGYFLVARLWDKEYLDELKTLTGCEIREVPVKTALGGAAMSAYREIVFWKDLRGWDGAATAVLSFTSVSKIGDMTRRTAETDSFFFFILMALILTGTSIFVTRSVSNPLKSISDALRMKDLRYIDLLTKWNNEFGDISRLIRDFFKQNEMLVKEIAERNQVEETLRKSEEKYRNIFDNTGLGIFQSTPEGKYEHVNPAFAKMAGFASPEEMISMVKDIRELYVNPGDRERLKTLMVQDGKIQNFETKIRRTDGAYLWILINARAVRDPDGKIALYDGTVQDITERKDAEDEIRDWMWRYELIVEASGQVAYDYHVPTGAVLWGKTLEKVLGYNTDELNGGFDQWMELLHPDDKTAMVEKLSKAKQRCSSWDEEYRIRHKDGRYVWVRDRGFFIPAHNGAANSQLGMIENITDKKSAQDAILEAKEYLNRIINTIADPVFVKDRGHSFTLVNDAFCEFLGHSREELIGRKDVDFLPEEQVKVFWSKDEIVFNTGFDNINEENITDAQGKIRSIVTKKSLYKDKNGNMFIVGILRDITERKKVEESLRLAQLGELVSVMAHEINNPVMIISGNAQLVMLDERLSEASKVNLRVIFDQCQRTKGIIQRLLGFSRPSKGLRKDVDMNKSIEGLLNLLEYQYSLDNIRIKRAYSAYLPMVLIDEHQMHEVFMNLLNNAKEAIKQGGEIEIATMTEGDFVRIDFKDSGPGIAPDIIQKIFKPFFTVKEKGTGLGLAICYGIVKAHDGELRCQSVEGQGAVFSVLLPARKSG